ncbi:MAG: hypothetical protein H7138_25095 [Myxococcales bacterium]|nr:hypothetical protein [Myxococcales bacterium]
MFAEADDQTRLLKKIQAWNPQMHLADTDGMDWLSRASSSGGSTRHGERQTTKHPA